MGPSIPATLSHDDLIGASIFAWCVGEMAVALRRGTEEEVRDPSFPALAGSIVLGTGGAFLAADRVDASLPGGDTWPVVAGLTMFWIGVAIRAWSIRTLGRFFRFEVVVLRDHRVIDTGPYRLVRHPSYTGGLLAFTGVGVALDNWLSVASLFLLPLIGFLRRIEIEEAVLTARLGEEYRRYKRRTKRLIPGVW